MGNFQAFVGQMQQSKVKSLVRELIGAAIENGHVFCGWTDDEIADDMLAYADYEIEDNIGSVNDPQTKERLIEAIQSIRHETK